LRKGFKADFTLKKRRLGFLATVRSASWQIPGLLSAKCFRSVFWRDSLTLSFFFSSFPSWLLRFSTGRSGVSVIDDTNESKPLAWLFWLPVVSSSFDPFERFVAGLA
jgi:hypothetical protein